MNHQTITYTTKTALQSDIYIHLYRCRKQFIPPLDETVHIKKYANKLFDRAFTFEAWSNKILVGLVVAYFNDPQQRASYITNVSVVNTYAGKGIASTLLQHCIAYARHRTFAEVKLKVNTQNTHAIHLYEKFEFYRYYKKNNFFFMKRKILH